MQPHLDWLERFEAKSGRPLRVLHVGNIANNAYLNAKFLREIGVEADVLCHDYYHIMGCPEWEDAEIAGHWGDDFAPDWESAGVGEFKRPPWFYQGPLLACAIAISGELSNSKIGSRISSFVAEMLFRFGGTEMRSRIVQAALNASGRVLGYLSSRNRKDERQGGPAASDTTGFDLRSRAKLGAQSQEQFICELFFKFFPDRDPLTPEEVRSLWTTVELMRHIFERYDIVQAYATFPALTLIAGVRPYIAYEHGTIRNVPFEDNQTGRLTAISYRAANHVFVTNCDNGAQANRLGISDYSFVPHPVNEDRLRHDSSVYALRKSLEEQTGAQFIVLHPSRQHWTEERHPDWEKGNDYYIRGFAKFVKNNNASAATVFVDWGKCVDKSKALIAELGITDNVIWVEPQPNSSFVRYIVACDAVADQFYLGAFGSLTPKALACGKPVLVYINEEMHEWAFEQMPPVANVQDPADICVSLHKLYVDSNFRAEISEKSRKWYQEFHSKAVVVDSMMDVYRKALDAATTRG